MNRIINVGSRELESEVIERMKRRFAHLLKEDQKKEIVFSFVDNQGEGDLREVLEFISMVRASGVPIRTINNGFIMSTAAILFLMGDVREAKRGCRFNFHPVSLVLKEIRLDHFRADIIELGAEAHRLAIKAVDFIESRTRLPRSEIVRLFSTRDIALDFDFAAAEKFGLLTPRVKKKA